MGLTELFKKTQYLAMENSPAILTAAGVTGTVTTAYLTGRASFKAADLLEDFYEEQRLLEDEPLIPLDFPFKTKAELVWKLYIPAVGVGATTITCITFANRLTTKRAAALAAAYSISERAFTEYKEKVVEKIGENKERAVRDEIAQDRIDRHPASKEVVIIGNGEVLCYDSITGRYFQSSVNAIEKAQNELNADLVTNMYASLSEFYDYLGLPATTYSEEVGWNINNYLIVSFSTCMSDDQRPCISMDFANHPIPGFKAMW